jgi:hypothetical protein
MLPSLRIAPVLLALLASACVRAGFSLDVPDGSATLASASTDGSSPLALDRHHDDCRSALHVDLGGGAPQVLSVDPAGATSDLALPCCAGAPDLIVQATGASSIDLACTGGGAMAVSLRGACGSSGAGICASLLCAPGNAMTLPAPADPFFLVVCRASGAGPAQLMLDPAR